MRQVRLGRGRTLAFDDVGGRRGAPVLYLHGTPDSRLSRHPDDGLAATAGVRLLAVDRPGYGGSHAAPPGVRATAFADDAARLLDALRIDRCAVLAWSGGALAGLVVAAGLGLRIAALGLVAAVVPAEAYDDPAVREAAPQRLGLLDLARSLPPGQLGEAVAPLLAPHPCDRQLAAEHQRDQRDARGEAELAAVPGAAERLADGLVEAVRPGLAGVATDLETQNRRLDLDLDAIRCPVRLWWGADDTVTPPAFGTWYAARLPGAELDVEAGAGHYLLFTRWASILRTLATYC